MPLPNTKDVSELMSFLAKDKPDWPQKQRVAVALSQARRSGAKIPAKTKKNNLYHTLGKYK